MDLLLIIATVSVYVAGASITFDRVGRLFDPNGDATQVKVGSVVTVMAQLVWPLTAVIALLYRRRRVVTTRPRTREDVDHPTS